MDLTNQKILDRYHVLSMLGEGAMGAVYLADDVDLKRQVALKVLRRELASRPDVVKRLTNECQIMARLGPHANIVTLYDRLVHEGDVILVMEFVSGESMSALIERTRMMNTSTEAAKKTVALGGDTLPLMKVSDALSLADQCLAGLDFAHSKGVLHRDIKPENIMVTRDHNGRPQAKIMDFGIGKAISAGGGELGSPMLTMVGGPGPGTPAYMAPEQIDPQRFGAVGPAADLYAFGVTLYQMLTLSIPFDGTYTELLNAHTNVEPPDPTLRNPAITPAMRAVLVKALRKNQQERYNSAAEFRMDLAAAGSGGGTMVMSTATGGFGTTPTKTSPGNRPGVGMATPVPTPTPVPAAAPSRRRAWVMPCLIGILLLGGGGGWGIYQWSNANGQKDIAPPIENENPISQSSPTPAPPATPSPIEATPGPTLTPVNTPPPTPTPDSGLWSEWINLKARMDIGAASKDEFSNMLQKAKNAKEDGLVQRMQSYEPPAQTPTPWPTPTPVRTQKPRDSSQNETNKKDKVEEAQDAWGRTQKDSTTSLKSGGSSQ